MTTLHRRLRFAPLIVITVLLSACAQTHSFTVKDRYGDALRVTAEVYLPDDRGVFPVVFIFHHCDGVGQHDYDWARRLSGWGYAAVVIDSFGPRGFRSVCTTPGRVTAWDRVEDLRGVFVYFRSHPRLDNTRAAVIGFSHGGDAAVKASQPASGMKALGLRAAVAYYPPCDRRGEPENPDIPLLLFAAEKDTWTPAIFCKDYEMQIRNSTSGTQQRVRTEFVYYPQALHGFDGSGSYRVVAGHAMAYDPIAAQDSFQRTRKWLDEMLTR